jgi:hypothetical protein
MLHALVSTSLQGSTRLDQHAELLVALLNVHLRRLSAGSRRTHRGPSAR